MNSKEIIVVVATALTAVVFFFFGALVPKPKPSPEPPAQPVKAFIVETPAERIGSCDFRVVRHQETGEHFMFVETVNGGISLIRLPRTK